MSAKYFSVVVTMLQKVFSAYDVVHVNMTTSKEERRILIQDFKKKNEKQNNSYDE